MNGQFQSECDRSSSELVRGEQKVILLRKLVRRSRIAEAKEHLLLDRSCPGFKDGFKLPDNSTDKSVAFACHNTTNQRQACKRPLPIRMRPVFKRTGARGGRLVHQTSFFKGLLAVSIKVLSRKNLLANLCCLFFADCVILHLYWIDFHVHSESGREREKYEYF